MGEVESAHGGTGVHGEAAGQGGASVFLGVEEIPDDLLFGVIGLAGVAGGGADAAILFLDQHTIIIPAIYRCNMTC